MASNSRALRASHLSAAPRQAGGQVNCPTTSRSSFTDGRLTPCESTQGALATNLRANRAA
eukprot:scaffold241153_cov28-Tisochrysis_lutea.AAC.1